MAKIIRRFFKDTDKRHPHVEHIVFECLWCGKEFVKKASYYRKNVKRVPNACSFCSRSCKSKEIASRVFKPGKANPNWKGGEITNSSGYKLIYKPSHPGATKNGYVFEHRLIMEKTLGRFLKGGEFVHHKNGNVSDNRIENLQIMTNSEHARYHGKKRKFKPSFKGRKHSLISRKKMRNSHLGKYRGEITSNK